MPVNEITQDFLSLVNIDGYEQVYDKDITEDKFFGMPLAAVIESEKRLQSKDQRCLAYFSMEYGLATSFYNKLSSQRPVNINNKSQEHEVFSNNRLSDYFFTLNLDSIIDLPIYSGGLGVLAGDTVKTMADYKLPVVAIGILWNIGYFRQRLWFKYGQLPEAMQWDLYSYPGLIPLKNTIKISLRSEDIHLRLWKYYVYSHNKDYAVPLILLDSNTEHNSEKNRHLTDQLYKSDSSWMKLMQRIILGMGGIAAINELGYNIDIYHLNEGHAVFSYLEKARGFSKVDREQLKKHFVYTCHTPVEAGHDRFSSQEVAGVLKKEDIEIIDAYGRDKDGSVNLTLLAMNIAASINAVSKAHQNVMHLQFPKYKEMIKYVTNGVHPHTWISDSFKALFEKYSDTFGDFRANPMSLTKAKSLRENQSFRNDIWKAHQENKQNLCDFLNKWSLSKDMFTVCWARRIAAYKRPSLVLQDMKALIDIAKRVGPIQIIISGKAHPSDNLGFANINKMLDQVDGITEVYDFLKVIMLENYDIRLAKILVSSVDAWLNNPLPPFEASGTSGMKAILNGVLQISTLDGWVVEAQNDNIGTIFGYKSKEGELGTETDLRLKEDSDKLYSALEGMVSLYYQTNKAGKVDLSSRLIDIMIDCVACSSNFNTYRMLDQYKSDIWNMK